MDRIVRSGRALLSVAVFIERPDEIWGLNRQPIWMPELEMDPDAVQATPETSESK